MSSMAGQMLLALSLCFGVPEKQVGSILSAAL
jgi:hypothetical protein